ncbi:HAD family phosphatase [Clostridium sp. DJ247]|uniref:HAD family hydrolase n=1 Tax=Clostridium sp. DJ247 TaxID=2726188 RepID=UPI001623EA56|nr:HAD family phosphatase [Clostridium sp. DJ247]MBC2582433.1 HAD family phosphatase [Clostridium sp. DJ247]
MGFKAIIFDKDGVIIDTKIIHYQVLSSFLNEIGFSITEEEYNSCAGVTSIELFTRLNNKFNKNYDIATMVEKFQRKYINTIRENKDIMPIKDVDVLIKKLHEKNFRLAVASSAKREKIELVLSRFELMDFFEVIVSGYEVNNSKPYPDIFLKTAEKLGVNAKECIVIEDSTNGIRAAKTAGMFCVGYNNLISKQDLCEADIIINDFNNFDIDAVLMSPEVSAEKREYSR